MIIFRVESVYSHGMSTTSKHISKFQTWKEKHGHKNKYWVGFDCLNIPIKSCVSKYQNESVGKVMALFLSVYSESDRPTKDKIKDQYLTKWVVMF